MALVVRDLITQATQLVYPNLGPSEISESALMSQMGALDDEIVQLVHHHAPHLLVKKSRVITITTAQNPLGYSLEDAMSYERFTYVDKDDNLYDLTIVDITARNESTYEPSAYISQTAQGPTLFPIDEREKDWAGTDIRNWFKGDGDRITYLILPQPHVPADDTTELMAPDFCRAYIVQSLVTQILAIQDVPVDKLQKSFQREQELKRLMLTEIYRNINIKSAIRKTDFSTTGDLINVNR